jgi:hypothetical protein
VSGKITIGKNGVTISELKGVSGGVGFIRIDIDKIKVTPGEVEIK